MLAVRAFSVLSCSMAGLGFPPSVYDQNGNECMNSVLQRKTHHWKEAVVSAPKCAHDMHNYEATANRRGIGSLGNRRVEN